MGSLLEKIQTLFFSPPLRSPPPWTPCAPHQRCASLVGRTSLWASLDAGRLQQQHQRRGWASPRCPPRDAWRPARGRRCGWGAWQRLCTSSGTTCLQTTARVDNPWPRYKHSNTLLSTSTSFQTSWAAHNGRTWSFDLWPWTFNRVSCIYLMSNTTSLT